ncbi:Cupin domain protein [Rhizobium sp. NFR07]|uniref:cupin domain-containing protein n=1 Tax=Rhizobium sp. NFR07 TaxID=1566262 RepID=UPI0008F02991|nr:cupin domain-containing protein [Rhizobium sp. NFR07]SFB43288.1 Cupin domain protein [Rhizobium sp. NFR07]
MLKAIATAMIMIAAGTAQAGGNKVNVIPVTKTAHTITGQPIALPQEEPEVTVLIYEVPPGAAVPQSSEAGIRYDYVLSGHLRITNPETGAIFNFSQGDFVVGRPGQWRTAENPDETTMKLLVIRQAPFDKTGRRWLRTGNGYFLMPMPD